MNAISTTKKTNPIDRKKRVYQLHSRAHDLLVRATQAAKRFGQPSRKPTT